MNITPLPLPWFELAIVLALVGSLWAGLQRDPLRSFRWGLAFSAAVFACTVLAAAGFYVCKLLLPHAEGLDANWSFQAQLFGGRRFLVIDEVNAPLLPVMALLHFLTALATGRTKVRRFSITWSLAAEALRLATFGCTASSGWLLVALLGLGVLPGYIELLNRGRPTRVYLLHMGLFVILLVLGWAFVNPAGSHQEPPAWATVCLLAAILIRCGTVPAHCWVTDWFEHASFGNGLLAVAPLMGVYAAVRLVLPIAPDWVLRSIGLFSLVTAVYAAGMAVVQKDARRFFAYLFLSHASLVLVGLELHTAISLTGALALWISVMLSLGGLGLMLRALEARFGRVSLADFHGLYHHSPALAVCFAITGLASVGFPGTLGFVAAELLVDGAVEGARAFEHSQALAVGFGLAVVLAAAINGIAIVRAYFMLFTGTRHPSAVSLNLGLRERVAVLTLIVLLLGGGLFPQPGIWSRYHAAEEILNQRQGLGEPPPDHGAFDENAGAELDAEVRHAKTSVPD
jgi:NADH-quinone oxidoreductase subunit M